MLGLKSIMCGLIFFIHYWVLIISTTFPKSFICRQFVFAVLTMPSPSRENVIGFYTASESTKGEVQPTKATQERDPVIPGFVGQFDPVLHY